MSIIIKASRRSRIDHVESASVLHAPVRELLDHIAVELATEYVRLMETAADAETSISPTSYADD